MAMQFQEINALLSHVKFVCVAYLALAMQQLLKYCRKIENSEYSCNYLSANFASTPRSQAAIFLLYGSAMISENCIAVASEKLTA